MIDSETLSQVTKHSDYSRLADMRGSLLLRTVLGLVPEMSLKGLLFL